MKKNIKRKGKGEKNYEAESVKRSLKEELRGNIKRNRLDS